jgi:hypothetical protein
VGKRKGRKPKEKEVEVTATFNGQEMPLEEAAQKLAEGTLESAELNKIEQGPSEKELKEKAQEEREAALSPEAKEILVKARREIESYWRERDKVRDEKKIQDQYFNRRISMIETMIEAEIKTIDKLFEPPAAQKELDLTINENLNLACEAPPPDTVLTDVNDVPFIPPEGATGVVSKKVAGPGMGIEEDPTIPPHPLN